MSFINSQGHMLFPSVAWQVLSQVLHLLSVSILAHYISRRLRLEDISSYHGFSQISWPRALVVLTFIDSWAFMFTSGILVGGAGMELNTAVCTLGILSCIIFYATSKFFIYLFLAEKVFVVWSPTPGTPRFKSPVYIVCFIVVMLYFVVAVNMIQERITYFRNDGVCVIGLKRSGSLVVLSYDLAINFFLTGMFLYPLLRAKIRNLHIRRVGQRAVFAALVALSSSCVNFLVLTILHGTELAWICLGSCGLDVIINSTALFWVTSGTGLRPQQSQAREVMAAATDGPFKQNGAFICLSPSELRRLSLPRSFQLQEVSIPSPSLPQSLPYSAPEPPKLESLHLSLSPIPDWSPLDDRKRSSEDLRGDDIERACSRSTPHLPQSCVAIPDRAQTPGRTIRPFLSMPLSFRRRHADRPTDGQINVTMQTEVGRDSTLFRIPSYQGEGRDMFEDIPIASETRGSISRTCSQQWNPGGRLEAS